MTKKTTEKNQNQSQNQNQNQALALLLSLEEKEKLLKLAYPDQKGLEMWRIRDEIYYNISEGYDPYDWEKIRQRALNPPPPPPPHPNDSFPAPESLSDLQVGQKVWHVRLRREGRVIGFPTERWDDPNSINGVWGEKKLWESWAKLTEIRILPEKRSE